MFAPCNAQADPLGCVPAAAVAPGPAPGAAVAAATPPQPPALFTSCRRHPSALHSHGLAALLWVAPLLLLAAAAAASGTSGSPGAYHSATTAGTGESSSPATHRRLQADAAPAIWGGGDALQGRYPWAVSIAYAENVASPLHFCGGSLIGERLVLTAAQ